MSNFWKDQYKQQWAASNKREQAVADRLLRDAGVATDYVGFGAGTTEYLSGTAAQHGKEKGGADLKARDRELYFEVTGSHKPIAASQPIWIRPDKITAARAHYPKQLVCVVHCSFDNSLMRVIPLDQKFFAALDAGEFKIVTPYIRGNVERYYEISANHISVKPWAAFAAALRM